MPLALPVAVPTLTANLAATTMLGVGVPKYATGVVNGLALWQPQIFVNTKDVGSAGSGRGVPLPLAVPPPLLLANLTAGMASQGLMGVSAPLFLLGLSNGLSAVFGQMLVKTQHVGVGTGTGTATFQASPSLPALLAGFAAAGITGPAITKKAQALAFGLDRTFASLVLPIAIVGTASSTAATGVGFGKLL